MNRTLLAPLLPAALSIAMLGVACGGDGGTETTERTVDPAPAFTPAVTDIPALDLTLNAALAGDEIELAALTGYQRVPCVAPDDGGAASLTCRESEASGERVEVLPVIGCQAAWYRPEQAPDAYRATLSGAQRRLVAVYVPKEGAPFPNADQIGVIDVIEPDEGVSSAVALAVDGGRVIAMETECEDVTRLYAEERVGRFIVPPGGEPAGLASPTAVGE